MTKFSKAMDLWWNERIKEMRKGSSLEPLTLRGIYYLIRQKVGQRATPKGKGFYSALTRLEDRTKVSREDLQIISESKISFIDRNGEKPLLKVNLDELDKCIALLYIEKGTIIASLEKDRSLTDRGLGIIKAMGFSTRDISTILQKAQQRGMMVFTLLDFDPSGCLIDEKLQSSGIRTHRIGVDPELVKELGLKLSDVIETIPRANKNPHLKYLEKTNPSLAKRFRMLGNGKPSRIEIDAIYSLSGKAKFVEAILKRADLLLPNKPVKKALDYKKVPKQVEEMRGTVNDLVDSMFIKTAVNAEQGLIKPNDSFNNIRLSKIEEQIEDTIEKKAGEILSVSAIEETIKALQKLLEEQKAKEKRSSG